MSDAPEGYPKHIAHVNGLAQPEYAYREFPKWVRSPCGAEKLCYSSEEERDFLESLES